MNIASKGEPTKGWCPFKATPLGYAMKHKIPNISEYNLDWKHLNQNSLSVGKIGKQLNMNHLSSGQMKPPRHKQFVQSDKAVCSFWQQLNKTVKGWQQLTKISLPIAQFESTSTKQLKTHYESTSTETETVSTTETSQLSKNLCCVRWKSNVPWPKVLVWGMVLCLCSIGQRVKQLKNQLNKVAPWAQLIRQELPLCHMQWRSREIPSEVTIVKTEEQTTKSAANSGSNCIQSSEQLMHESIFIWFPY